MYLSWIQSPIKELFMSDALKTGNRFVLVKKIDVIASCAGS